MDINELMKMKYRQHRKTICLERFTALNSPAQDRYDIANANSATYTVFINRRHTLAHIVARGESFWVRIPIKDIKGLKSATDRIVECYFSVRMNRYLMGF